MIFSLQVLTKSAIVIWADKSLHKSRSATFHTLLSSGISVTYSVVSCKKRLSALFHSASSIDISFLGFAAFAISVTSIYFETSF